MAFGFQKSPLTEVIPTEEFLQYIHPSLLKFDLYENKLLIASIIAITTISFTVIMFTSLIFVNMIPSFRALRTKHRIFMCLAISRAIYGVTCIFLGSYAIFTTTNLDRDVVYGKTASSSVSVYFSFGFFIFELAAVITSDLVFKSFSKMLITHHSLALLGYGMAIYYQANHSFGCKALMLEMSTPFSCLCFVLLKLGMENSRWWKVNQILLVHTFHLRSVVECHLWYITYCNWEAIWETMPVCIFISLYANLTLVTFVMTPYWGYKKTQQLFIPIDWNFQESRVVETSNGEAKKVA